MEVTIIRSGGKVALHVLSTVTPVTVGSHDTNKMKAILVHETAVSSLSDTGLSHRKLQVLLY